MGYTFPEIDLSVAFGMCTNDPKRHKEAHYHKKTTEWIYVVEGKGSIERTSPGFQKSTHWIEAGDWIEIPPGESHALRNYRDEMLAFDSPSFRNNHNQHLVVVCMCEPQFDMTDVHYR